MGYPWQTFFALAILSFISVATFQLFPFWPNSLADLQGDPSSRSLTPVPTGNVALTRTELHTKQKNVK